MSSRAAGGSSATSVSIADVDVSFSQTHITTTHWHLNWISWPALVQKTVNTLTDLTDRLINTLRGGTCFGRWVYVVESAGFGPGSFRPNHVLLPAGVRPGPGAQTGARVSVPQAQESRSGGRENTNRYCWSQSEYVCKVQYNHDGSPALRLFCDLCVSVRVLMVGRVEKCMSES